MKRRVQLSTLIFLALALASASAQPAYEGGVAAAATETSVLLRWLLPDDLFPAGGFVVTREGAGETRRFEVPSPMPQDAALASGFVSAEEYAYLEAIFGPGAAGDDPDARLARALATLTTIVRPNLARVAGTLFEDDTVTPGTRYTYTVSTAGGRRIGAASITAGEVSLPPAVTNLRAQARGEEVALRWRRPPDETLLVAYHIYREQRGETTRLTQDPIFLPTEDVGDVPFYRDDTVEVGNSYRYVVEGIDLFGRVAPRSAPVAVAVPDPNPLAVPEIEDAEVGDLTVTLHFTPPDDPRVARIGVLRTTDVDTRPVLITPEYLPSDATRYTDSAVRGGVDYYYALVSVDGAGRLSRRSTLWAVRAVNPTPPSAPANLEAFSREDGIALDWQAPPEEDVGSYRIYVSREQSAPIEEFRYLDSTVQTSYHEPMEQGNLAEIRFYVRAVNTSNVEGPPSEVVSARLLDVTPPAAPYLRDVSVGERRLSVTWSATSNPDVASYRLYRAREDGDFRLIQGAIAANVTRYQDDDVEPGVLYRYALEAVDASGNVSERSNVLSGRAYDLSVPQAVTGLSATLTDDGVRLAWDAQSGLRYVVERARGADGAFFEISDLLDGASFVDAGGQPGDRYRVFAVGDSGRSGPPSPSVEVRE